MCIFMFLGSGILTPVHRNRNVHPISPDFPRNQAVCYRLPRWELIWYMKWLQCDKKVVLPLNNENHCSVVVVTWIHRSRKRGSGEWRRNTSCQLGVVAGAYGDIVNLSKTKLRSRIEAQFVWELGWTPLVSLPPPLEVEKLVGMEVMKAWWIWFIFVPKMP